MDRFVEKIETERLVLRPFKKSDSDDVFAYAQNIHVGPNAGWKPHSSREESLFYVKEFIKRGDVWAIEEKESGRVIGSVGLHTDGKRDYPAAKMLGYVLSVEKWGRGYATEASLAAIQFGFERLGLQVISIYHFPHNSRSRRVVEKCGFNYEGILRRTDVLYDGRIFDNVCYSMTREEYFDRIESGLFRQEQI